MVVKSEIGIEIKERLRIRIVVWVAKDSVNEGVGGFDK